MTPEPTSLTELAQFLGAGGLVLWLLACLSVGALTVMLAKWWQWWHQRPRPRDVVEQALAHLADGDRTHALRLVRGQRNPRARLLGSVLDMLEAGTLAVEDVRTESIRLARAATAALDRHLRILEVIASLAPLLGLFGTVLGMIDAFQALEAAGRQVNPAVLSGGIWKALLTTAAGLAVAIPVSMANSWFERRVEVESAAMLDALERTFTCEAERRARPAVAPARVDRHERRAG